MTLKPNELEKFQKWENKQRNNKWLKKPWQERIGYAAVLAVVIAYPPIIIPLLCLFLFIDWRKKSRKIKNKPEIFEFSFFSNKVAHYMFRAGYPVQDMPPNHVFKLLCDALKANGYNAEQAADLWVKCLRDNNKDAIRELRDNTGAYGVMMFGTED